MNIGKAVLVKHNEVVVEGIVQEVFSEDLEIRLDNGELIRRKYWEIRVVPKKEVEEQPI
jgi:hypothetical protein